MKKLVISLFTLFLGLTIQAQEARFTSFNIGESFTAITIDAGNKKVWAGTQQKGVFSLDTNVDNLPTDFSKFTVAGLNPDISNIRIKDMAADHSGNIWIAHEGINFSGSVGGMERINSNGSVKHYTADRNGLGISYAERDGLGGLRLSSVAVDKNNRVWTTNRNHNITSGSTFFLTPGDISYKDANATKFTAKAAWFDKSGNIAAQPPELPYPAFTFNPGITETAQARNMEAISIDDESIWVGVWAYKSKDNDQVLIPRRVLKYNINGTFEKQFTDEEMKFPVGGVINGICANGAKGTWVTNSATGRGFSVYKNNVWTYIDNSGTFQQAIPPDTKFNSNAIWKDGIGRVFMGTNKGLIVYNGFGEVDDLNAYKLYTDYDFGGNSGNDHNVIDETMLSSNITGGCADPDNPYRSWVATDNGIMKVFIPIEGMKVYHVRSDDYGIGTPDNEENIKLLATLRNELQGDLVLEDEIPSIAADGSSATVFRFETDDPVGHYEGNAYELYLGPGPIDKIFEPEYINQYGYFFKKNLDSYEGNPQSAADLKYVEYLYQHPEYIDEGHYLSNKNYAKYDFKIFDVATNPTEPTEIYKHTIKIAVPPVLLGHGVWSDVSSLEGLDIYLKDNNYDGLTLKAWRVDGQAAEKQFSKFNYNAANIIDKGTDSWVIPTYINKLKDKAADNMFSAGKVNVIVHSRGGLYTKSYIEGIDPRYPYKGNINSLITLNTPHFGSQAANLALDKRVVLDNESAINTFINKSIEDLFDVPVSDRGLTIGNVVSVFAVPKKDRVKNWGARNLLVENDNLSQVTADEDVRFIENLNSSENEAKLAEVPLHVISSTFDACDLNPVLCNDLERIDPTLAKSLPKQFKVFLYLYNLAVMVTNDIPNGLNNAAKYVYNGEESDMIVPASSMRGGLGGSQFSSEFTKIIHVNTPVVPGITEAPEVHERIKELLKSDVHKNQGLFTKKGIEPSELTYNFLPNYPSDSFTGNSARNNFNSKILINRDPAIFDNRVPGNTLDFKIYVEDVDKIIVSYENENTGDLFSFEIRNKEDIQFSNDFSFTIPENYFGKTTITAQGYKEGIFGYASNTVTLNVGVHPDAVLQSIKFAQSNPIFLNQENYNYDLIGTFSDGIDRIINDLDGVTFSIEDPTIISQVDNRSVKGETAGSTILTATYNDLEAGVFVTIEDNPALFQTILSDFYGELSSDGSSVAVFWNTLREFENQTFILETSYGTPDNFREIYTQLGNGTNTLPAEFSYFDTGFGDNELIFYRLKMVDVSGNETFSTIIEVNKIISSTTDFDNAATSLKLFPNPTNLDNVKLSLNANFSDKNARLDVFNLQGKRLYTQAVAVLSGTNEFDLTLPTTLSNNIYLVKISTLEFVKSIKLVVKK